MSAAQAIASNQFLTAMGPMIEDKKAMEQVLFYIGTMRRKAGLPTMTMEEAEQHGMLLHQAMNQLREKARAFYQA